nr:family 1 glycosylhydrolase [Colwellia maritima]
MVREIYPKAFSELLVSLNEKYPLPPIYITENGAATDDKIIDGVVNDTVRVEYYQQHLNAVNDAIEQGVNIKGYFAWSLMDNFEWAEGYLKRFGIVYVDYKSQVRTIKSSGYAYQALISNR